MRETAIEYIKRRLQEDSVELADPSFKEIDALEVLKSIMMTKWGDSQTDMFKNGGVTYDIETDTARYRVVFKQKDSNSPYDHYTFAACACDSTMVFLHELFGRLIGRLIDKAFSLQTIHTKQCDPNENPDGYTFIYEVDKVVMMAEYGDSIAPEGKPWMESRFTAFLPIKFSVIRKPDGLREGE